ncbi:MAG: hypothetical protein R3B70_35385 [Polyangiaceae bacterium]
MLGNFLKRLVNAAVLGLAGLTFFLVPFRGKTLFRHSVAVFTSQPAREAGAAIADASRQVASTVQSEVNRAVAESGDKPPPKEPHPEATPSSSAAPRRGAGDTEQIR